MLNEVKLIGNLGADPEVRSMPSGDPIANVNVATSRRWKDRNTNERKEETEWHRVVFFGGLAKIASEYLKKGSQIYVKGRLRTHKWQGQDGQDRYTTEIVAEELLMLGRREGSSGSRPPVESYQAEANKVTDRIPNTAGTGYQDGPPPSAYGNAPPGNFDDFDDDIPF